MACKKAVFGVPPYATCQPLYGIAPISWIPLIPQRWCDQNLFQPLNSDWPGFMSGLHYPFDSLQFSNSGLNFRTTIYFQARFSPQLTHCAMEFQRFGHTILGPYRGYNNQLGFSQGCTSINTQGTQHRIRPIMDREKISEVQHNKFFIEYHKDGSSNTSDSS